MILNKQIILPDQLRGIGGIGAGLAWGRAFLEFYQASLGQWPSLQGFSEPVAFSGPVAFFTRLL